MKKQRNSILRSVGVPAFTMSLVLTLVLCIMANKCTATPVADRESNYDLTLQPISAAALKQQMFNYSDDAVMIYQLVLRAQQQKEADVAYETMKTLRHHQPNNAVVLAGYCMAFDAYEGKYSGPDAMIHSFSGAEQEDYASTLARAQQINPKLWMVYAVEGHNRNASPGQDLRRLDLYKKAEKLAPFISYTHTLLGDAYATYYTPYNSFPKAALEYDKALTLQPASVKAAYGLFDIYDVRLPNAAKAKQAKRKIESLLPHGFALKKQTSERLAKY